MERHCGVSTFTLCSHIEPMGEELEVIANSSTP
jgi:hypothetical protein